MKRYVAVAFLFLLAGQRLIGQEKRVHSSSALDVNAGDLLARPVDANWSSYNGDYTGRRFSSLREINRTNIAQMRASWVLAPGELCGTMPGL